MQTTTSVAAINNLILGLFLALALGTWWLSQQIGDEPEARPPTSHIPDYWIERISARIMDAQGRLRRVIGTDKLQHFPDTDKSNLLNPKLDFLSPDAPPWQVRAISGWIEPNGETLMLQGLVTVTQDAAPGKLPVRLETQDLKIRPKEQYAETNQLVRITSGLSNVQSQGMQIWLKEPIRIKLLAAVRAHYEVKQ